MKKKIYIMLIMLIVNVAGAVWISGCTTLSQQLVANPECRHFAPYAADVFADQNNVPVRIGIRKISEKKIGSVTIPISHAWAEARINENWVELGSLPDGSIGIDVSQTYKGSGEQYFSVVGWHQFRSALRANENMDNHHVDI
jgi:hypothetical protein